MQLSEELTGTENKIAFARQAFNDSVMTYNTAVRAVPEQRDRRHVLSSQPARAAAATEDAAEASAVQGAVLEPRRAVQQSGRRSLAQRCTRPCRIARSPRSRHCRSSASTRHCR
ncbi:MAG: LemA family protein [Desulfosudis oleivorans]|nr:LemA family protein [Desulfosudis oleivorans]